MKRVLWASFTESGCRFRSKNECLRETGIVSAIGRDANACSPIKRDLTEPACEILGYLVGHPGAQDRFDGIVHWWILERSLKAWLPVIAEAVTPLVEHGFLEQRIASDGTVLYRMNPTRIEELQLLFGVENGSTEGVADEG